MERLELRQTRGDLVQRTNDAAQLRDVLLPDVQKQLTALKQKYALLQAEIDDLTEESTKTRTEHLMQLTVARRDLDDEQKLRIRDYHFREREMVSWVWAGGWRPRIELSNHV